MSYYDDVRLFAHYNRKTKKQLIEQLMYATDKKRLDRESLVNLRFKLEELRLSVDYCKALPESEKSEIRLLLNALESIIKFNIDDFDREIDEKEEVIE